MKNSNEHECQCGHEHSNQYQDECNCNHTHDNEEDMITVDGIKNDKYHDALSKYNLALKDDEMALKAASIIEKCLDENNTIEVKKELYGCLDLTSLKCTDNEESIMRLVDGVNKFDNEYPHINNVAAICVYPNMAEIVNDTLEADHVNIACVAGGFPSSQTFTEVKIAEAAMAIHSGADEIDIVMPVGKFLSKSYEEMCDEISEIKEVCGEKKLKVILETGILTTAANIKRAAILCMYSGADFIKTSTGKESVGATPEAALVMCQAIKEYFLETGRKVGFKAAGGISTVKEALIYYTIVKEILGKEWLNKDLFRIGTSCLAQLLQEEITA